MAHNYTASLRHAWQYSCGDLKKFFSGQAPLLETVVEKTIEAGVIVTAAGLLYKVIQIFSASNSAYQVYAAGLRGLNVAHQVYTSALQWLL